MKGKKQQAKNKEGGMLKAQSELNSIYLILVFFIVAVIAIFIAKGLFRQSKAIVESKGK